MTESYGPTPPGGTCAHHGHGTDSCIGRVPIFNHLTEAQMAEIAGVTGSRSLRRGELLFAEGDASGVLYVVNRGKLRMYRLSKEGKEQLVRILRPGDFTGELALFRDERHESYCEALEDTEMCVIRRADLEALMLEYPTIALHLLREFSARLEASERQTTRFATERVDTRLALYLLELMPEATGPTDLTLPMARKDIASYLGTTPETVSRKLLEFETHGYIRQLGGRQLRVLDPESLRNL